MDRVSALNNRLHDNRITVTRLAEVADIHRTTLSKFLNRRSTMRWGTMEAIMSALWSIENQIEVEKQRKQRRWTTDPDSFFLQLEG